MLITVEDFTIAAAGRHFLRCLQCSLLYASAEESLLMKVRAEVGRRGRADEGKRR